MAVLFAITGTVGGGVGTLALAPLLSVWSAPDGKQPKLARLSHGRTAVTRAELGVDTADMRVDRVDGDVERSRDLGPREVCRQESQHPQFAWAELFRLR